MSFANIPNDILDRVIGEYWDDNFGFSDKTLKDELSRCDEDIIHADFKIDDYGKLVHFIAWTDTSVLILISDMFGESSIMVIPRNPYVSTQT